MKSTAFIVVLLLLCTASSISAAVFNVSTPAQFSTAINTAATNGEDDVINVAAGTYNIAPSLIYLPTDHVSITIQGAGAGSTVLDGGGANLILAIDVGGATDTGAIITIRGITFRNGLYSGAAGGLVAQTTAAHIVIENCAFVNNNGSSVSGNGGGASANSSSGTITFTNNTFTDNIAASNGSGAYANTSAPITFTGNTFTNNDGGTPASNGGGAYASSGTSITYTDNTFTDNNAGADGAGAYASTGGPVTFTGNTFTNNDGGTPASNGGGLYASSGTSITLTDNIFTDNDAGTNGAGAYASTGGPVTLTNNVFSNNNGGTPASNGGGVYITSGNNVSLINNTVTVNSAGNFGGGVYISTGGPAINIYNNILWSNTANAGGNDGDDLYITNSPATAVNLFNNDIGINANLVNANSEDLFVSDTSMYTQGSNIQEDPLLTPDFHLQSGSPAINAGTNNVPFPGLPPADFESQFRIAHGTVDIGADEYGSTPFSFSIPTMTGWGMIVFAALAGVLAVRYSLRRPYRKQ